MPSNKRRRPVSPAEQPTDEAPRPAKEPSPISVERYQLLPSELRRHIIDLACLAPASAGIDVVHFNQDLPTILNICLVSRAFKAQATFSLYRHISITRPSSLYALQQVLQKHPQRAALIRSLHIGPRGGPLPAHWWPLTYAYRPHGGLHVHEARLTNQYCEWITTSLTKDQLPSGYETLEAWPLGSQRPSGCREAAIHEALVAACSKDQLDVNVERPGRGQWFSDVGTAWVSRIFELQAALDLYLLKIRRMEDEDPSLLRLAKPGARIPIRCRNGACDHYPALVLVRLRKEWPRAPSAAFRVNRAELLRHLARPGPATDRFDHPMVLARSGFEVDIVRPERRRDSVRYEVQSDSWDFDNVHEKDDFADLAMQRHDDQEQDRYPWYTNWPRGPLRTATLGSTLQLARSVVASLTNLDNLSLTGYLIRVLAHGQSITGSLRRLTIGPAPPCWSAPLTLNCLDGIRELRICGGILTAEGIENLITRMKHMRVIEWSIATGFQPAEGGQHNIVDLFDLFINGSASQTTAGQSIPQAKPRQPCISDGKRDAQTGTHAAVGQLQDLPLIIVHLNARDFAAVRESAPSREVLEAWLIGENIPHAPRRLWLVLQPAPVWLQAPPLQDSASEVWEKLYDEGRRWWRGEGVE